MLKNFLKIALRNLLKRKAYTFINVMGLATGMAVCLLIILFITDELNYDQFQAQGDDIYRMVVKRQYPGRVSSYAIVPQSYAYAVKQECPEVKEAVRIFDFTAGGSFQLRYGDQSFEEKRVLGVDSNFFKVFTAKILAGSSTDALLTARSVVLTATTAKRYFGSVDNALGKLLQPEGVGNDPLKVTAVCADWPANAHFTFDLLLTTVGNRNLANTNYVNFAAHTYVLLNKNTPPASIEARFPHIIEKYAAGDIEKRFAQTFSQFQKGGNGYTYYLQPLKKIHLISNLENELRPNGSLRAIYIFGAVAVFILLIACINFINLSTARSTERAKEVGIRKTFGSQKKSLISQFLVESTLLSICSIVLAILLAFLLLPFFNQVSNKQLQLAAFFTASHILITLLLTVATGLAAGLYPAFVLSSFRPIAVLKGNFKTGAYGTVLRNGLVIFQFSISVILIICALIVNAQMEYMTNSGELGFTKDNVIIIERADLLGKQTKAFKNELMSIPGVAGVSGTSALPGQANYFGVNWALAGSKEPAMTGRGIITDDQYQQVLNLDLKAGRFFSKSFVSDSLAVVLNEKAANELGLKNPIGARLSSPDGLFNAPDGGSYTYTVVGVLKDFHFQSLRQGINPLVFTHSSRFNDNAGLLAVKIKANQFTAAVHAIEKKWIGFVKGRSLQYSFFDKTVEAQYHAEQTTQKIFTFFSSLAIFIACIGLLGLAAYATQQRTREIGIRKVLGASATNIVKMLSIDFLRLVLIASLLAFPLAWWAMHAWLQDFAYRISIGWWAFAIAGVASVLIALATISFQAVKAALANPVKSLRTE
jgi:putative ABC transport system permease protein